MALIKRFTGRDPVKGRFLYREHFEYFPQGKLWLAVNDLPRVPAGDPAIWRRMQVIPFVVTIPPEKRDKALGQKLLRYLLAIQARPPRTSSHPRPASMARRSEPRRP